jgi:hypothetical protein
VTPSNEAVATIETVLEFKTFRSPERKKQKDKNDTVTSLCPTGSVDRKEDQIKDCGRKDGYNNEKDENSFLSTKALGLPQANSLTGRTQSVAPASNSSFKKTSVTFSPVPPPSASDKHPKTPVRSPSGGRVGSLPNLYDAPIGSPSAIFLSPTTPTSKSKMMGGSFTGRAPLTPRTPKDRLLTTPTDFAFDYGKFPMSGSLLDSSNVLSWLHSPSANGLFSPGGGFGSMMNTPKGGAPRTPRTPTVTSTSFFFSDVAGLPRASESSSSSSPNKKDKRGGNSMICISPLSSHKAKDGIKNAISPKFNIEMFASPAERSGMAKLGMKMSDDRRCGSGLDAVSLADPHFTEDEDLAGLLQLANNTPRPSAPPATVSSSGSTNANAPQACVQKETNGNLPVLSLGSIGVANGSGNGTKLARKTQARDLAQAGSSATTSVANTLTAVTPTAISSSDVNTIKHSASEHNMMIPFVTSYHHHEAAYNPTLYPGLSHGGSMRVVVGGPPRTKIGTSSGTIQYTVGRPGDFPAQYPPSSHYPPRPGVPPHMHHQFARYPPLSHHGTARHTPLYTSDTQPPVPKKQPVKATPKRPAPVAAPKQTPTPKKAKKQVTPGGHKKKNRSPQLTDKADRQKAAATIQAVNQASGGKNDKAAALAAAILRGVTMRPSGKWQAQLYFAGKSRYIGVFDTREKAALAYEIARERLKAEKNADGGALSPKQTENAVNTARKAAFDGVNERGV